MARHKDVDYFNITSSDASPDILHSGLSVCVCVYIYIYKQAKDTRKQHHEQFTTYNIITYNSRGFMSIYTIMDMLIMNCQKLLSTVLSGSVAG